jgi:hypothetical protein
MWNPSYKLKPGRILMSLSLNDKLGVGLSKVHVEAWDRRTKCWDRRWRSNGIWLRHKRWLWSIRLAIAAGSVVVVPTSSTAEVAASACSSAPAMDGYSYGQHRNKCHHPRRGLPFDDGPAPISISGSSTTMPVSTGLPPVPPYSAVSSHFRSASVSRSSGITLTPML